ncbi:Fido domain-containing protein [Pseudomonas sp. IT-347P]|uniref:hypothetical protein n=1 Tax=Pseudomonas sp. IT-347P TaxID=3026458 RepID=UPI0039DF61C9
MVGKPPRKPVTGVWKKPDLDADGSRRTPDGEIGLLPSLHVTEPRLPAIRSEPAMVSAVTPEQAISVSLMNSITDEVMRTAAGEVLADFRIAAPSSVTLDARGIWTFKRRDYVAIAEDQFVQVVTDPDSGLFRATNSRELKPSGPLLVPDNDRRFWYPLESDGVTFIDSMPMHAAQLFRRMGRSVAKFSGVTVARMLAVSGVNESILRDVLVHDRHVPFLLEDTVRRFELDQQIQAEGRRLPNESFVRFKDLEEVFEADCDESTSRMRRVFPDLPKTAAQAIWRNASAAEHLHMQNHPGIPQALAKEALVALRDIRLARACEGIYLETVSNPDSDRLVLHMIGNIADWPRQIRIEIRRGAIDGEVLSAIGDVRSPVRHILIRQDTGYTIPGSGASTLQGAHDLYSTVVSLLSPVQRKSFGVTEVGSRALQELIRAQPLPSRQRVSDVLRLPPLTPLSIGTSEQNRHTGFLRGGADDSLKSKKSFEDRLRDLYPEMSGDDVTAFIHEHLQHDSSGVLNRLEIEFSTLRQELEVWCDEVPPPPILAGGWSAEALAEQRQLRQRFSQNVQAMWQRQLTASAGEESFSSFVDFIGELPPMSVRFEHVAELVLEARHPGVKLGRFLDSFPTLSYLVLEKVRMDDGFAPGIFQMRGLQHLILKDCSLRLSEADAEGLSRIETLTLLRLDGNPLGVAPHVGFMQQMKELYFGRAGLKQIPSGIEQLRSLKLLDLHDNDIVDVGFDLFEIPDTQDVYVNLIDNPLSQTARLHIDEYLQSASMDSQIIIRTQEQEVEGVFELSDFSDSGMGSDSD